MGGFGSFGGMFFLSKESLSTLLKQEKDDNYSRDSNYNIAISTSSDQKKKKERKKKEMNRDKQEMN